MDDKMLPVELLFEIFAYLDSKPPSYTKIRQEPALNSFRSDIAPLKHVSLVSRRWRRIVLPLLFEHARLRIDVPVRTQWTECPTCTGPRSTTYAADNFEDIGDKQNYHRSMMDAFTHRRDLRNREGISAPIAATTSTTRESFERPDEASTAAWAWRMHHALLDFCHFVRNHDLAHAIRSFLLSSDRMLSGKLGRFPHQSGPQEWRYPAAAAFWQTLLSTIDPDRIVVLAPPTELACLTNASIDTLGDWAFADMDFHILELRQERVKMPQLSTALPYTKLESFPISHPSFAPSSVLHLRQWTHATLNEGSFLKAYGTYEYFEHGPPSLIFSIKEGLASACQGTARTAASYRLSALRSFTYIASFPFSEHADFSDMLPYLEEIDLQFAPHPSSRILDDKARVGKAELMDCWQEMESAYARIAHTLSSWNMSDASFPRMKRLICRDYQLDVLTTELDDIFTPLCLPVWVDRTCGVFTREAMSFHLPETASI